MTHHGSNRVQPFSIPRAPVIFIAAPSLVLPPVALRKMKRGSRGCHHGFLFRLHFFRLLCLRGTSPYLITRDLKKRCTHRYQDELIPTASAPVLFPSFSHVHTDQAPSFACMVVKQPFCPQQGNISDLAHLYRGRAEPSPRY